MNTRDVAVILVDDHEMLLRGLTLVFDTIEGVSIAATTTDGARALELARQHGADVVVTDAQMPGVDGLGVVSRCAPEFPVLVLTTYDDSRLVSSLVEAGAAGYVLKDIAPEELARAVTAAADGGVVLDPRIARYAYASPADELAILTRAERAVARCVARGMNNREIAGELSLAEGTMKNHVSHLLRKLGARDRTALALRVADSLRYRD
ncbi:response regulator [Corynebacterium liangguodongii]|uniref:DNA-binding response regulator n=1 Tax=Corynebacterium liangguodongii TaxID=2079535 RepID=A0A2S0WD25_9CORY|nr:response regulator transcription factor [Corynebacterium liangguodongii]AWB83666.1 DNA-binding response regulator [Corynebacterium liangguodongii]PWB99525.1 DNA-binding response regulator [Corynebacterium liangguodongii]